MFDCAVINGELQIFDQESFYKHLIPFEGAEGLQLVLKKKVKSRSRQEEKYYYAVPVKYVAEAMDITREEAHDFLKDLLLKTEESVVTPSGTVARYTRTMSTTELGDAAYRDYWGEVLKWAALPTEDEGLSRTSGLGLYIPSPNEVDWDGKEEYMNNGY
jgi:hypothetical protein